MDLKYLFPNDPSITEDDTTVKDVYFMSFNVLLIDYFYDTMYVYGNEIYPYIKVKYI